MKTKVISKKILSLLLAFAMVFAVFEAMTAMDVHADETGSWTLPVYKQAGDDSEGKILKATYSFAFSDSGVTRNLIKTVDGTESDATVLINDSEILGMFYKAFGEADASLNIIKSEAGIPLTNLLMDAGFSTDEWGTDTTSTLEIDAWSKATQSSGPYRIYGYNELYDATSFYGDATSLTQANTGNNTNNVPTISLSWGTAKGMANEEATKNTTASALAASADPYYSSSSRFLFGIKDDYSAVDGNRYCTAPEALIVIVEGATADLNKSNLKGATATLSKTDDILTNEKKEGLTVTVTPNKNYKFKSAPIVALGADQATLGNGVKNDDGSYTFNITNVGVDNVDVTVTGEAILSSASGETPTGDETMLLSFIILMMLAAGGTVATVRRRS